MRSKTRLQKKLGLVYHQVSEPSNQMVAQQCQMQTQLQQIPVGPYTVRICRYTAIPTLAGTLQVCLHACQLTRGIQACCC